LVAFFFLPIWAADEGRYVSRTSSPFQLSPQETRHAQGQCQLQGSRLRSQPGWRPRLSICEIQTCLCRAMSDEEGERKSRTIGVAVQKLMDEHDEKPSVIKGCRVREASITTNETRVSQESELGPELWAFPTISLGMRRTRGLRVCRFWRQRDRGVSSLSPSIFRMQTFAL
jgi:hypothetical protein